MLQTIAPQNQLAHFDRLSLRDAPFFVTQSPGRENDEFSVLCEGGFTRFFDGDLKKLPQRVALYDGDGEIILRQKKFAVLAKCEMRKVAPKFRTELFSPDQTWQLFFPTRFAVGNDVRLPLQKTLRSLGGATVTASRRQLFGGAEHFAQTFFRGADAAE